MFDALAREGSMSVEGPVVGYPLFMCGGSRNVVVTVLMEESNLLLLKLMDEINDKLNEEVSNSAIVLAESVTYAMVKSNMLFMG